MCLELLEACKLNKFSKKQNRIHIGNLQSFRPHILLNKKRSPVVAPCIDYDNAHVPTHWIRKSLYYFTLPGKPHITGELRLGASELHRVMILSSSFEDHLVKHGRVHFISVLSKRYFHLHEKLREGLCTPAIIEVTFF